MEIDFLVADNENRTVVKSKRNYIKLSENYIECIWNFSMIQKDGLTQEPKNYFERSVVGKLDVSSISIYRMENEIFEAQWAIVLNTGHQFEFKAFQEAFDAYNKMFAWKHGIGIEHRELSDY
jgi:hypothetical protein